MNFIFRNGLGFVAKFKKRTYFAKFKNGIMFISNFEKDFVNLKQK